MFPPLMLCRCSKPESPPPSHRFSRSDSTRKRYSSRSFYLARYPQNYYWSWYRSGKKVLERSPLVSPCNWSQIAMEASSTSPEQYAVGAGPPERSNQLVLREEGGSRC